MGVIRKPTVFVSDSEESLNIPEYSEDESVQSERSLSNTFAAFNIFPISSFRKFTPTRGYFAYSGRRKCRRFENVKTLTTLVEDEELLDVDITDFIPGRKSKFAELLEDKQSLEVWYEFVNSDEDTQCSIICEKYVKLKNKRTHNGECPSVRAFQRIDKCLQQKLKACMPLGLLEYVENKVLDFFGISPHGIFKSADFSSFERLLLHGVSQYHSLLSKSFDSPDGKSRYIEIVNPADSFQPVEEHLTAYLQKK